MLSSQRDSSDSDQLPENIEDDDSDMPEDEIGKPVTVCPKSKLQKIIVEIGTGIDRPGPIDEVIVRLMHAQDQTFNPEICIQLGTGQWGVRLEKVVISMRKNEIAEFRDQGDLWRVHLVQWNSRYDLKGDGNIIKKTISRGSGIDRPSFLDTVYCDIQIGDAQNWLFEQNDFKIQIDAPESSYVLSQILRSMKNQENSQISIKQDYYNNDPNQLIEVISEHISIELKLKKLLKMQDLFDDGSILKTIIERSSQITPTQNSLCTFQFMVTGLDQFTGQKNTLFESKEMEFTLDSEQIPDIFSKSLQSMTEGEVVQLEVNLYADEVEKHLICPSEFGIQLQDLVHQQEYSILLIQLKMLHFEMGKLHFGNQYSEAFAESQRLIQISDNCKNEHKTSQAIQKLENASKILLLIHEKHPSYQQTLLKVLENLQKLYLEKKTYFECIEVCNNVLNIDENECESVLNRCVCYRETGQVRLAREGLLKAKEICEGESGGREQVFLNRIHQEEMLLQSVQEVEYKKEKSRDQFVISLKY